MALRIPARVPTSPFDRATCEHVLEALIARGPVIDADILAEYGDDDPTRIQYARDVLGMFAGLGQVEHVRRELWIIDTPPETCADPADTARSMEFLRAEVAARAIGDWCVIAGTWALALRGVTLRHLESVTSAATANVATTPMRFALTTRRARPATYAPRGQAKALQAGPPSGALDGRHVTLVRGAPIAAVTRPAHAMPDAEWLDYRGRGAHVLGIIDAFVSLLEYPRLSGGFATARHAALPVLGRVGLDPLLAAGRLHPTLAVRRRLSFVLFDVILRTEHAISFLGPGDWGTIDDEYERWRIPRTLGVADRAGAPTLLDPHREATGTAHHGVNIIDNRSAPLRARATTKLARARPPSSRET